MYLLQRKLIFSYYLHTVPRALIFGCLIGVITGILLTRTFYYYFRRIKTDEQTVLFYEKHFPDQCPWLVEKKLLAEAEELRLKAKDNFGIQQNTSLNSSPTAS